MSVRLTILSQMQALADEQTRVLPPLSDDTVLLESGFDSLSFAILALRLEDALGVDPFTESEDAFFPVTLGDFVKFYENATARLAA